MSFSLYSDLTDAALTAKVAELLGIYETIIGGTVAVIQGNGRRMEYTRADSGAILKLLKDARTERDRRAGVQVDGAIGVWYPA